VAVGIVHTEVGEPPGALLERRREGPAGFRDAGVVGVDVVDLDYDLHAGGDVTGGPVDVPPRPGYPP
jgi:hypothetical protein